jgi:hypothetical protein
MTGFIMQPDGQLTRAIAAAALAALSYYAFTYLQSPLRRIPGPFLATFTDLWRVGSWWTGRTHLAQIQLHRRFGPAVRLGPNMVSLGDPALIPTVYATTKPWLKVSASVSCRAGAVIGGYTGSGHVSNY